MDQAQVLLLLAAFGVIAVASDRIGRFFTRIGLPLITGFLCTGLIAGPYVLDLISAEAVRQLRFVDEIALAFIAYAAGSELYLRELRSRLRSVAWVSTGLVISTFILVAVATYYLAAQVSYLRQLPAEVRVAVALMAGAVLVARSPSSAIAVVNELRARGPYTQLALGVTVIMDVVVIVLFAVNSSAVEALLSSAQFDFWAPVQVMGEVGLSILLGALLGRALGWLLSLRLAEATRMVLLMLSGWGVYALSMAVREASSGRLRYEVLLEPLLICMVAGFTVSNFTRRRAELRRLKHRLGPAVYVAFFTLAGASLAVDTLLELWPLVFVLFVVRLLGIVIGAWAGGALAGDPARLNRMGWMAYVTQAGIGLGLAKEIAIEFPGWGDMLATLIIAVIVVNQIVGPPLFKRALRSLGEAQVGLEPRHHTAVVFGLDFQSAALAQQLQSRGWSVRLATRKPPPDDTADVDVAQLEDLSLESLRAVGADRAETLVVMMPDDDSYEVARLAHRHFGTRQIIVRLNDHENWERFHALGVEIVDPATAVVSLLDHWVRSPSGTSILLGLDGAQDVVDFEVRSGEISGTALRDLRLPLDSLLLSVTRRGQKLICHGDTRLEIGDRVSVVGSREALDALELKLG